MVLLADRVRRGEFDTFARTRMSENDIRDTDFAVSVTDTACATTNIFEISNLAKHYFSYIYSKEDMGTELRNYPCIAPPYSEFFMEYKHAGEHYGMAFQASALKEDTEQELVDNLVKPHLDYFSRRRPDLQFNPKDVKFVYTSFQCVRMRWTGTKVLVFSETETLLNGSGRLLSQLSWLIPSTLNDEKTFRDASIHAHGPMWFALSVLNCKNIVVSSNNPPKKLSKANKKRHGEPLTRFKTLVIDPKTVRSQPSAQPLDGSAVPLHSCRAHFKDYRGKGLFGRYPGVYWWGPQMRGDPDEGVVIKSYKINGPNGLGEGEDRER